jgi:hypothetical protein
MNISTIQKRRFLENIYKLYYSNGAKPTEQQILNAFSDYFSVNKAGFPLDIDYAALNGTSKTNVDILNELMINGLFNLDVLYDAILENNDELFTVATTLNKKIENLKTKRKLLESKVDNLLFVNNNTDGYFYSYTENFSSADKIDIPLTTGYVDTSNGSAVISSENSERYSAFALDNVSGIRPKISLYENGTMLSDNIDIETFNNVFDGLNDTYWLYEHRAQSPIPVSIVMNIPINRNIILSKIEGYVLTSSPVLTQLKVNYSDGSPQEVFTKNSNLDYDVFSFSIKPKNYSSVELTLFKNEPDYIDKESSSPYVYRMGLRDLIIGSVTRSKNGTIVSKPISLPVSTNNQIVIDSVSLDVQEQYMTEGAISYFVAVDNPNATSVYDFNWTPISPSGSQSLGFKNIVNFDGSLKNIKYISSSPTSDQLQLIPVNESSKNINDLNPNTKIYQDKKVYRAAALDQNDEHIMPMLLGNLNSFKHYYYLGSESQIYKDVNYWVNEINNVDNKLLTNTLVQNLGTISTGITSPSYGYIQTKISCETENTFINNIKKSITTFDLAVYLNGIRIADLPSGKLNEAVEWNFLSGINDLVITYNKPNTGAVSFTLTDGTDLSTYGSIFTDYFFYLNSFDFRNRNMNDNLYFTIDNPFGRKEIITSAPINGLSRFSYLSNKATAPSSIRYRIDLTRFENPFASPKVDSLKIKFKHKDL